MAAGFQISNRVYFWELPPASFQDLLAETGAATVDGIVHGAMSSANGALPVVSSASKCASGRKACDIKLVFRGVLGEGVFCKQWDKLGISKWERDGLLILVIGPQCKHSRRRSAQYDCSRCSFVLWSVVVLVNWIDKCTSDSTFGIKWRYINRTAHSGLRLIY